MPATEVLKYNLGKTTVGFLIYIADYKLYVDIFAIANMKDYKRLFLLAIFFGNCCFSSAQQTRTHDLQKDWLVYKDNAYRPFTEEENGKVTTVYFTLQGDSPGGFLSIRSYQNFALFINGELATQEKKGEVLVSIDSLMRAFNATNLLVGIHQKSIHKANLNTSITRQNSSVNLPSGQADSNEGENAVRDSKPSTYFMDFVLVGTLIILSMLVVVTRLNAKLASDYFSISRIFSLRESEDNQLHGKITSSSNMLFYSYCSLIVSFYLMIIFHFVPAYFESSWPFQATSFFVALLQWLKLSLFVLALFFSKIILIYLFSRLFSLQDVFGTHVFNWIRTMLIFFGALLLIVVAYHITRGQNKDIYLIFMWATVWILGIWVIVVFPKVMRKTNYSLFHIFSYICATEILPLLISIKIIYY